MCITCIMAYLHRITLPMAQQHIKALSNPLPTALVPLTPNYNAYHPNLSIPMLCRGRCICHTSAELLSHDCF